MPAAVSTASCPAPEIWKKILFWRLSWISLSSSRRDRYMVRNASSIRWRGRMVVPLRSARVCVAMRSDGWESMERGGAGEGVGIFHRPAAPPLGIGNHSPPPAPPLGMGNREWGIVGMGNDAAGGGGGEKRRWGAVWGGLPPRFPIPDCPGKGGGAWRIHRGGVVGRWIIPHSQGVAETALDWPESPA